MKTRLITSVVGLALLAVVMMFFHTLVFETVVAILAVIGLHEIYMAMKPEQGGLAIFGGMAVYTAVMMFSGLPAVGFITQPLTVLLLVFVACCVIRNSRTLDFKKVAGMLTFGAMLLLCFYSLVELKYLLPVEKYGSDALYIIFLILGFLSANDRASSTNTPSDTACEGPFRSSFLKTFCPSSLTATAVSYTHLDVYKRQALFRAVRPLPRW